MVHWFASLTWSQAAAAVILGVFFLCGAGALLGSFCGFSDRPVPPRRHDRRSSDPPLSRDHSARRAATPWPVVDYSAQYAEKSAWLGDNGLLARPVNKLMTPRAESKPAGNVVELPRAKR